MKTQGRIWRRMIAAGAVLAALCSLAPGHSALAGNRARSAGTIGFLQIDLTNPFHIDQGRGAVEGALVAEDGQEQLQLRPGQPGQSGRQVFGAGGVEGLGVEIAVGEAFQQRGKGVVDAVAAALGVGDDVRGVVVRLLSERETIGARSKTTPDGSFGSTAAKEHAGGRGDRC